MNMFRLVVLLLHVNALISATLVMTMEAFYVYLVTRTNVIANGIEIHYMGEISIIRVMQCPKSSY